MGQAQRATRSRPGRTGRPERGRRPRGPGRSPGQGQAEAQRSRGTARDGAVLENGRPAPARPEREEKIVADAAGYEQLAASARQVDRRPRTGIRNLAGVQEGLKDETAELIERLEGRQVFALTLKRASRGMTAARRLQALKTDDRHPAGRVIGRRALQAAARRPQARHTKEGGQHRRSAMGVKGERAAVGRRRRRNPRRAAQDAQSPLSKRSTNAPNTLTNGKGEAKNSRPSKSPNSTSSRPTRARSPTSSTNLTKPKSTTGED